LSAAKQKGTAHETAIVNYLNSRGIPAYRPAQSGFADHGDIHGVSPFILQAKDWRDWQSAIREGLDGAQKQRVNAGEPYGVAVVKRARKSIGEAYVVLRLEDFASLLLDLRAVTP
jgi:hypothetical protein